MADVQRTAPPTVRRIEAGHGRTVLVVVAHADDPALFLGGTIRAWADEDWRVVVIRATDDRWDSVGSNEAETISRNRAEFERAAAVLGIAEIIEFGHPTDRLGDHSEVALREQIIREVRRHRPYALVTFDPYAMFHEDNEDHRLVARATDEAFWTAQFDLHHPEHLADGLEPHGVFERWYFGRRVVDVTDVIDISATVDRKVEAALCHDTMLRNYVNQLRLQARTGGWRIDALDEVAEGASIEPVMGRLLRAGSARTGEQHGVAYAEEYRVVRFGGLSGLLDALGTRIEEGHP